MLRELVLFCLLNGRHLMGPNLENDRLVFDRSPIVQGTDRVAATTVAYKYFTLTIW